MKKRYLFIDYLRVLAAICIVILHVGINGKYYTSNQEITKLLLCFSDFVFVFMELSAFSVCCGYYDEYINNETSIFVFYERRIKKILPFFALLSALDVFIYFTKGKVIELMANLSLLFGFLPNSNLSVIGVGWTLGVIFIFYFLFPLFAYAMKDKKKIWILFLSSVIFNLLSCEYFQIDSTHFIYDIQYFLFGCLLFLYKDKISNCFVHIVFLFVSLFLYVHIGRNSITTLLLSSSIVMLSLSIENKLPRINIVLFVSKYSMELYLSHMVFYRALEKACLLHIFSNNNVSFVFASLCVVVLSLIFAHIYNKVIKILSREQR